MTRPTRTHPPGIRRLAGETRRVHPRPVRPARLSESHPRYSELVNRAWALEKEYGDAWRQAFRDLGAAQLAFRRGFPETLSISVKNFLANAERLFALAPIRCLHLCLCTPNDVFPLAACSHLAMLTTLNLEGNAIDEAAAAALAGSPHVTSLTTLILWGNCIGNEGAAALAGSPHLAGLLALDLGSNRIGDAGAEALACSPHLASLTTLNLADNYISSDLRDGIEYAVNARRRHAAHGTGH